LVTTSQSAGRVSTRPAFLGLQGMTMPVRAARPSSSTPKVTPRELEVLGLIADGHSTREIAKQLWITDETVRTHVRRLLNRLGARTRAHAVAIAYRDGLWAGDRESN
jgi:DNA-binding CsgD family transcriptional regulator